MWSKFSFGTRWTMHIYFTVVMRVDISLRWQIQSLWGDILSLPVAPPRQEVKRIPPPTGHRQLEGILLFPTLSETSNKNFWLYVHFKGRWCRDIYGICLCYLSAENTHCLAVYCCHIFGVTDWEQACSQQSQRFCCFFSDAESIEAIGLMWQPGSSLGPGLCKGGNHIVSSWHCPSQYYTLSRVHRVSCWSVQTVEESLFLLIRELES